MDEIFRRSCQDLAMTRRLKRRLALAVAVAAIAAGGAIAAVSATGQGTSQPGATHVANQRVKRLLSAAAAYLDIPATRVRNELQSGKTIAQIANDTPGKSEAGLIQALTVARKAKLAKATANVSKQVSSEVNRPLLGAGVKRAGRGAGAARRYLGLSSAQIRSDLLSGQTLAQIANDTPGKSETGLIEAIVATKTQRLEAALSAGRLNKASESARFARLAARVKAAVNRPHTKTKSG
jgi:hypothetical protein